LRSLAKNRIEASGKSRSARSLRTTAPTWPVAPTTPRLMPDECVTTAYRTWAALQRQAVQGKNGHGRRDGDRAQAERRPEMAFALTATAAETATAHRPNEGQKWPSR